MFFLFLRFNLKRQRDCLGELFCGNMPGGEFSGRVEDPGDWEPPGLMWSDRGVGAGGVGITDAIGFEPCGSMLVDTVVLGDTVLETDVPGLVVSVMRVIDVGVEFEVCVPINELIEVPSPRDPFPSLVVMC